MAANFLKANNHQQGKIFFNSYKAGPLFYFTVKLFFRPLPWRSTASGKWEKMSFPAACLQGIMPGDQSQCPCFAGTGRK